MYGFKSRDRVRIRSVCSISSANFRAFADVLNNAGIPCTIRIRRGIDIQAGCGQLATKETA